MKYRLRFCKLGQTKYIGHLDLMRFFQKVFIRAGLPLSYSKGFHPHPILSFAAPLGVGVTSEGEYLDVELDEPVDIPSVITNINQHMPEGIRILSIHALDEGQKSAMAQLKAASYRLSFVKGIEDASKIWETIKSFLDENETLIVLKKTKKSEREVDIKPLIYRYEMQEDAFMMLISTGSTDNLQPLLVPTTCLERLGINLTTTQILVHRLDMFLEDENHQPVSFSVNP